jgi:hypothetical protein
MLRFRIIYIYPRCHHLPNRALPCHCTLCCFLFQFHDDIISLTEPCRSMLLHAVLFPVSVSRCHHLANRALPCHCTLCCFLFQFHDAIISLTVPFHAFARCAVSYFSFTMPSSRQPCRTMPLHAVLFPVSASRCQFPRAGLRRNGAQGQCITHYSLICVAYRLHGVECLDLVSLAPFSGQPRTHY